MTSTATHRLLFGLQQPGATTSPPRVGPGGPKPPTSIHVEVGVDARGFLDDGRARSRLWPAIRLSEGSSPFTAPFLMHPDIDAASMDDVVEEMPPLNALAAFLKYLDVREVSRPLRYASSSDAFDNSAIARFWFPCPRAKGNFPFAPCLTNTESYRSFFSLTNRRRLT